MTKWDRTAALLSISRALLGAVSPALYGGCVTFDENAVFLTWYVDPAMTEDEREDLRIAGTEVMADAPGETTIEERFVRVSDTSAPLPTAGDWIYLQRGFRTGKAPLVQSDTVGTSHVGRLAFVAIRVV